MSSVTALCDTEPSVPSVAVSSVLDDPVELAGAVEVTTIDDQAVTVPVASSTSVNSTSVSRSTDGACQAIFPPVTPVMNAAPEALNVPCVACSVLDALGYVSSVATFAEGTDDAL